MSVLTYRTGPTQLVRVAADPAFAIRPGMLLGLFGTVARPASAVPWAGDLDTTREIFADLFLGVAHSAAEVGGGGLISVDISPMAVYAPGLDPGGCQFGEPLAPADDGGALADDRLAPVAGRTRAVAMAMEAVADDAPAVRVTFASKYCPAANHADDFGSE